MKGIDAKEIPELISSLVKFVGKDRLFKTVSGLRVSEKHHGSIYNEFYLRNQHPWARGLATFKKLRKKGFPTKDIPPEIAQLARDARLVFTVCDSSMPKEVKREVKSRLRDPDSNASCIHELVMAERFASLGAIIDWLPGVEGKRPEFVAHLGSTTVQVECKSFNVDTGYPYRRRDFYYMADKILKPLTTKGLTGYVDVTLDERLLSSQQELNEFADEILTSCGEDPTNTTVKSTYGTVALRLERASGIIQSHEPFPVHIKRNIPEGAMAASLCPSTLPKDPLTLTLISKRPKKIVRRLFETISKAQKQFDVSKYGVIYVFLPHYERGDLPELNEFEPFGKMVANCLAKERYKNVAALCFVSGPFVDKHFYGTSSSYEVLGYRNEQVSCSEIKNFPFWEG